MLPPPPPVALFTYNRPAHTAKVLQALARNRPARLFVFQDGLRAGDDPAPHAAVSRLVDGIDFVRAEVLRQPANVGLADSIIGGVTQLFDAHETLVVLEDDCVPSAQLLPFMQFALARFADEPRVFSVSGYALPTFPRRHPYDVCFSPLSSSWGWATWRDRWRKFDRAATGWQEMLADREARRRFAVPGTEFPEMLRQQMTGQLSSWAIRWYYTLFKHDALCVWPLRAFVRNIGMDGSGVHCVRTRRLDVELCERFDAARVRVPPRLELEPVIARAFRRAWPAYSLDSLFPSLAPLWSVPYVARDLARAWWRRMGERS
jgi:hypothetical protein